MSMNLHLSAKVKATMYSAIMINKEVLIREYEDLGTGYMRNVITGDCIPVDGTFYITEAEALEDLKQRLLNQVQKLQQDLQILDTKDMISVAKRRMNMYAEALQKVDNYQWA